jgi:1,4-dihydroxy-6-naphthoate synthase
MNSGSALGKGVGPLLVQLPGKKNISIETQTIALPGEHTTAHFLFTHAYPNATQKIFLRYDQIEEYVLQGKGPGVIIHENRFTYANKGLMKLCDLGERWESSTNLSIPLGGIVMKKTFPSSLIQQADNLIRKSIEYARENYPVLTEYVTRNAQEMEESIMRRHIDLYVNDFSVELRESGKNAIRAMMQVMALSEDKNRFFVD